ncbi:hypothetical protein G3T16_18925 [Kineobactrum salinum]|uniref:Uncharacterized protein n=2 Tax=Kineobactrum salinum TaxID=2708301 RepID=A0A6C0U822_9GAMM|nr:DUF6682 family protein [Kineobactrum salinum]QIB67167.1 hypothetical protein G3T16_18925 [Kineobactrum salinum]
MMEMKPQAFSAVVAAPLVAGAEQTLAAAHYRLLDVPGSAVTRVAKNHLDAEDMGWEGGEESATLYHYCYDENTPRIFYVYPPVIAGTELRITAAVYPDEVTTDESEIPLPETYLPTIVDYLLFRAYGKHSKAQGNERRSTEAFTRFAGGMGVKATNLGQTSPNTTEVGS